MFDTSTLAWAGALLLLLGELWALRNVQHLKKVLLFSTIAELGYALLGFGLANEAAEAGAILHLCFQMVMRLLVFISAWYLIRSRGSDSLQQLAGSGKRQPLLATLFGFGLFSVMGLSPFKGAYSKFLILYAAVEQGQWTLALIGTFASIIAAVYYLIIIQRVCLEQPNAEDNVTLVTPPKAAMVRGVIYALTAMTIFMSLDPEPFLHFALSLVTASTEVQVPQFDSPWHWLVLVPYIGGFILYGVGYFSARWRDALALVIAGVTLVMAATVSGLDGISYLFGLVFALIALVVVIYSRAYIKHDPHANRYYFFLFLMTGSLLGVASAADFGNFYLFWELMTWTSYFLVIHEQTPAALKAGKKYFLMCASGAYIMHFGILVLHAQLGSFEMSVIAASIQQLSPAIAWTVLISFIIGLGVKTGLVPMHSWLPDAHPVAPSSISAPMSSILTKAGVYGLAKVMFVIFGAGSLANMTSAVGGYSASFIVSLLGVITLLYGEIKALNETNLKRMLAYSTLAQVGEIAAVLGVGTYLATMGSMMHVMNHAIFKSLLFLAAGAIIYRGKSKTLSDLKGIGRKMPVTFTCFAIGLLSIMGLPPFSGFFSKFMMVYAVVQAGQLPLAIAILLGSVIGAVYYVRILRVVFFERYTGPEIAEAPTPMLLALVLLAGLVVLGGVFPQLSLHLAQPVAELFASRGGITPIAIPQIVMEWSPASLLAGIGAVLVYFIGKANSRRAGITAVMVMALALAAVLFDAGRYNLLSFWFALLIAAVGVLNLMYSIGYMQHGHAQNRFFFFFVLMIGGLLGVTASHNLFNFFAFWEIMSSWTLYFVIIHEETEDSLNEGFKYFMFNFVGASCLFLGVVVLSVAAGSFDFAQIQQAALSMPLPTLAAGLGLALLGLLMKAAQLPFKIDFQMHPPTAPTPVSGYISAVLLKSGPWGVLKLFTVLGGMAVFGRLDSSAGMSTLLYVSAISAAITLLYAGAMALIQTGIKRLLIYSTVSQLAYVLLGISLSSSLGIAGGLMHFVNHMMLKNILFLAAGCILAQLHVESLDKLGGLGRKMPYTFGLFLFAGLSLSGIPPLNGFASKWLIYQAAFQSGHYLLGMSALISSLFTLAAVLKFAHVAFMGQPTAATEHVKEAPLSMLLPMFVLAFASVLVGIFPGLLLVPIANIIAVSGLGSIDVSWLGGLPSSGGWHPLTLTLMLSLLSLCGWWFYRLSNPKQVDIHVHSCGVTDLSSDERHVKASGLYEAPEKLIRTVLFQKKPA
ncbi:proton-conducting transporter membrane subunit [Shewanella fodinae]|uniref:Formate hydrogenlyase subunit 3/multisubunit Na+/H+ antiporter MnhD subunit n=1 Tax=Shewanella fodinae TaxID=552357 RepID=A0A4V2RRF6_9GAMM|nr:proton-conducting transporter membrane subunit [Shewanella fodinae]TCN77000.1 formate hydrogenlyase subunit 3/multisubunit Na+/H+ antiporter MnhD subunit [Shewanella fodinae]